MARRILDSSILIKHWRGKPARGASSAPKAWARKLIEIYQTNDIVTPVAIEFACGARTGEELRDYREFLSSFEPIDGGRITASDWAKARAEAERIPRDGKPRQLGDCLVLAIAGRLSRDIETLDRRFRR